MLRCCDISPLEREVWFFFLKWHGLMNLNWPTEGAATCLSEGRLQKISAVTLAGQRFISVCPSVCPVPPSLRLVLLLSLMNPAAAHWDLLYGEKHMTKNEWGLFTPDTPNQNPVWPLEEPRIGSFSSRFSKWASSPSQHLYYSLLKDVKELDPAQPSNLLNCKTNKQTNKQTCP